MTFCGEPYKEIRVISFLAAKSFPQLVEHSRVATFLWYLVVVQATISLGLMAYRKAHEHLLRCIESLYFQNLDSSWSRFLSVLSESGIKFNPFFAGYLTDKPFFCKGLNPCPASILILISLSRTFIRWLLIKGAPRKLVLSKKGRVQFCTFYYKCQ